jgi:Flp pilus assembly protein CpaB
MFSLPINTHTNPASTATVEVYVRARRNLKMARKFGYSVSLAARSVR